MPDQAGQLTPEEAIRQKLQAMLAQGKVPGGTPPFVAPAGQQSAPGTGMAANAGNDPNKPTPPTITPTTPQGGQQRSKEPFIGDKNWDQYSKWEYDKDVLQKQNPGMSEGDAEHILTSRHGEEVANAKAKPFQTDEEWAKANQGAAPGTPAPYKGPGWKETLARSLMYGAIGFANPAAGARVSEDYVNQQEKARTDAANAQQQYPATLHQAREKEEMNAADLAAKQATTQNLISEAENRRPPEPKGSPLEKLQQQYIDIRTKNGPNDPQLKTIQETYDSTPGAKEQANAQAAEELKAYHPAAVAAAGPPLSPLTTKWGPVGEPPKDYGSYEAANSARAQFMQAQSIDAAAKMKAAETKAEVAAKPDPDLEKNKRMMGYAMDANGTLAYMSKAEADSLHSTFEEMKSGDVKADRQALRQLNDVQQNVSRYYNATNSIKGNISSEDASRMAGILSDKSLGAKLEPFGIGIDLGQVNDAITGTSVAGYWNKLGPAERDALLGYIRAKSSIIAYNKVLSGSARASEKQLQVEMAQLPLPYVGATVANKQLQAFQENIDRAAEGFPVNLPGLKAPAQVRKETEALSPANAAPPASSGLKITRDANGRIIGVE